MRSTVRLLRTTLAFTFVLSFALLGACSESASPTAPSPSPSTFLEAGPSSGVLVGAGDIGVCGSPGAEATAQLLERIAGTVITLGDNAYNSGTTEEFANCYAPTWGRHRSRTRPSAGNHEYASGGDGYFTYFGERAGPRGLGYYAYSVGPWRVVALNSEVPAHTGSAQLEWLRAELSGRSVQCTAVYWHRPLFSSGLHGDNHDMRDVWRTLYELDADLVLNGHDHTYERFAPQDPDGRPDSARGIRQFVVGTGGASLYQFPRVRPNSEVRAAVWGVAVFTLTSGGYQWEFVPVEGASFSDSGFGTCH